MTVRRILTAALPIVLVLGGLLPAVPAHADDAFSRCEGGDAADFTLRAVLDGEDARGVGVGTIRPGDVVASQTDAFSFLRIDWWGTTKDPDGDEGRLAGAGWPAPLLAPYVLMVRARTTVTNRPARLDDGHTRSTGWRVAGSDSPCYTYLGSRSGRLQFQVNDPQRGDNGGTENITVFVYRNP
uniref:hypothetical protein n=1 Tax=Herbidospora sakaeratensis TaxID=564415 RepID=UPI0007843160|nr:hypothetical protein [Herbidospora sakaeratensis]